MKRKIFLFSPLFYSVSCLILNTILSILCIAVFYLIFAQYFYLYSIIIGVILDFYFWYMLYAARNHGRFIFFMNNCASTCAEAFLYFHKDQKTEELVQGFKLISKFRNLTSWFWIYFLIYKNDKNVQRVFVAFKKFIEVNPNIKKFLWSSFMRPNEDFDIIPGFTDGINNRSIDYIRIEI